MSVCGPARSPCRRAGSSGPGGALPVPEMDEAVALERTLPEMAASPTDRQWSSATSSYGLSSSPSLHGRCFSLPSARGSGLETTPGGRSVRRSGTLASSNGVQETGARPTAYTAGSLDLFMQLDRVLPPLEFAAFLASPPIGAGWTTLVPRRSGALARCQEGGHRDRAVGTRLVPWVRGALLGDPGDCRSSTSDPRTSFATSSCSSRECASSWATCSSR